jgi:hypothetical protein
MAADTLNAYLFKKEYMRGEKLRDATARVFTVECNAARAWMWFTNATSRLPNRQVLDY